MRRKEKEITDKKAIESIMKKATVCRIALSDDNIPYVIPVIFGYRDNALYFHSAPEGKKIDILKRNNNVCFEMDTGVEIKKEPKTPCSGTVIYNSVVGFGKAIFIEDPRKKREALDTIVQHYIPGKSFEYSEDLYNKMIVIKIEISSVTGKKSGY